jgi:hypothetical protein
MTDRLLLINLYSNEIKAREYRRGNLKKGETPEKLATYRVHKTM